MPKSQTYSISEAAALTGRHKNTIRNAIRMGHLEAAVHQGKFGEEYRIEHDALVAAGFLEQSPLEGGDVLDADFAVEGGSAANGVPPDVTVAALAELYQRHEQAMFRLGYLQGELERVKALAETAESLQKDNAVHEEQLRALRTSLEEKERQAAEAEAARQELARARERLQEMQDLLADLDHLKTQVARQEGIIEALQTSQHKPWWRFWG